MAQNFFTLTLVGHLKSLVLSEQGLEIGLAYIHLTAPS